MGHILLPTGWFQGLCVRLASTWLPGQARDRRRPCGAAGLPLSAASVGWRGAGSVLTRNFLRRRLGRAGGEGQRTPRSRRNELC